jgi:hypothetical protein
LEFLKGNVKEMWRFLLLATRAFFLATARFYERGEWLAEAQTLTLPLINQSSCTGEHVEMK